MSLAVTRYRNVVFTAFVPKDDWKQFMEAAWNTGAFTYIVGQLEKAPGTGNFHIQGYAELEKLATLQSVKQALNSNSVHIEKRRGSQKQAIAYSKKEESREEEAVEYGVPKGQGRYDFCCEYCEWFKEFDCRGAYRLSGSKRCHSEGETTGFYSGGVFRNIREVQPRYNRSVQYPNRESFKELIEISDGLADIEELAESSDGETERAERSSDLVDCRSNW